MELWAKFSQEFGIKFECPNSGKEDHGDHKVEFKYTQAFKTKDDPSISSSQKCTHCR